MNRILTLITAAALVTPAFAATTWNGTTGNWLAGDAAIWSDGAFANGDSVTFDGTTAGTITVDAAGVAPTATTVSNTAATTFTGGSIGGTLTKTGVGSLSFTNTSNSFSAINVSGGPANGNNSTVASLGINNYNQLGTGAITFSNTAGMAAIYANTTTAGSIANAITLSSSAVITQFSGVNSASRNVTLDGVIGGGAAGATLFFTGSGSGANGIYTLNNVGNTFRGTLQVDRGALAITSNAALGHQDNKIKLDVGSSGNNKGLNFGASNITIAATHAIDVTDSSIIDTKAFTGSAIAGTVTVSSVKTLTKAGTSDLAITGQLTGAGVVAVSAGSLTLSNATNNYGSTTVNGGQLVLTSTAAAGTGAITSSGTTVTGEPDSGAPGSFLYLSGLTGSQTLANAIILAADTSTNYRKIAVQGSSSTTHGANTYNFSGLISGGGSGTILYFDSNSTGDAYSVVRLSNTANTFTGTVQFNRASLQIDGDGSLGGASNLLVMNAFGASRVIFNYAGNYTHATQVSTGTNFDTGANAINATGVFSGGAAITKLGTGSLTFAAINTNTAKLTVSAGSVIVANTGSIRINGGSGITIASGASLAVNGSLVATAATDTILNNGTLTGTGVLKIGTVFDGISGNTYSLITGTTSNALTLSVDTTGSAMWSSAVFNNATGVITFTAVPEPSIYGLLGAGALAGVAFVRRRKRA